MFCHITSHVPTDPYQDLLMEKGGQGWPHIVFLDAAGNVLGKVNGRSVEDFAAAAAAVKNLREAEKKVAAGDEKARVALLRAQLALGKLSFKEAKDQYQKLVAAKLVDDEARKAIEQDLINLEVMDVVEKLRSRDDQLDAGEKFAKMRKAGRIATGVASRPFWALQINTALANGDEEQVVEAAKAWKARLDPASASEASLIEQLDRLIEAHKKKS